MKTTLVFALLVVFLHTVCAELAETSAVQSSSLTRRLQEVSEVFGGGVEEIGDGNPVYCVPIPFVDNLYWRTGKIFMVFPRVAGPANCLTQCTSYPRQCVALNYDPYSRDCFVLMTVGEMIQNKTSNTVLYAFAQDDVCNENNFMTGYHRAGFDYIKIPDIESPKECCKKCREETPRCVAWDYSVEIQTCFLKDTAPVLIPSKWGDNVTTGFGAYCS